MAPHSIHPQRIIHNHFPVAYKCWTTALYTPHPGRKEGNSKTKRLVYRPVLLTPQEHSSPGSCVTLKSPATWTL